MKNKIFVLIGGIIILILGIGFYFYQRQKTEVFKEPDLPSLPPLPERPPEVSPFAPNNFQEETSLTKSLAPTETSEVIVKITTKGFEPRKIEVKKGTKVTWINEQNNPSWPASDIHPTHEIYPGSSIKKCGTPEQDKIFDACRGLSQGEKWSFVFNEVGEWHYHDHLNPLWRGVIIVK